MEVSECLFETIENDSLKAAEAQIKGLFTRIQKKTRHTYEYVSVLRASGNTVNKTQIYVWRTA